MLKIKCRLPEIVPLCRKRPNMSLRVVCPLAIAHEEDFTPYDLPF